MQLITAIVPFFTAVLTEKICRASLNLGNPNSTAVKVSIAIVTGLMLIAIEIIGAGIIAESVNQKIFYGKIKKRHQTKKEALNFSFEDEGVDSEAPTEKSEKADEFARDADSDSDSYSDDVSDADSDADSDGSENFIDEDPKPNKIKAFFSNAFAKIKASKKDDDFDDAEESDWNDAEDFFDEDNQADSENDIAEATDKETGQNDSVQEIQNELDNPYFEEENSEVEQNTEVQPKEEEVEERPVENPASIISQEEYAALIQSDLPPEEDELEWPNLPPQPETLPPEYSEDFDEDDPSLEFPPKDDDDLTRNSEPDSDEQNFISDYGFEPEEEAPAEEYTSQPRFSDAVRENPAFPHGITIHDNEEKIEAEEKAEPVPERKYPVKISLDSEKADSQNSEAEILSYNSPAYNPRNFSNQNINHIPLDEQPNDDDVIISDIMDDYEEDITIPEPDYDNMNEEVFFNPTEQTEDENGILDSDFFDIDLNAEPESEDLSDDIDEDDYDDDDVASAIFEQIAVQESPKSINSAAQKVFSDMEADIRKEQPKAAPQNQDSVEDNIAINSLEPPLKENSLNPNAHHATNLTADELTDFFNAQQEQNTPVTNQIEGNLPTTNKATKKGPYVIPSDLLTAYKDDQYWIIDDETKQASIKLKQTLAEFNIEADIIGIKKGPVVTMFELLPAPGVKLSKIVTLQDNIALSLAAQSVRIVAPIPGKQAVGIEVPNRNRSVVGFREIIEMNLQEWNKMSVPVVLGKDILGKAQLIDLVKTPHMLIAGATGSGKSVCVNSLILSILYKRSFKDVKLILVDPKVVELKLYNNIPHLLTPVITEPKKALQALQYCLCEMERRYALLDGLGVRDISSYNQRIKERNICTEKLPYIVVIIDEFADLMATSGKELESIVARLTAMSRAVGIHLVLATQRPSVNVITGLIKANIPTRIAFMVASRTDSNIIIDSTGAEKLLGRGDMLYASAVDPYPIRIQGTFVTDQEVEDVVNYVKQYGEPDYIDDEIFVDDDDDGAEDLDLFGNAIGEDPLYDQALEIVVQAGKASASYIQRRLKIGYNRAARLVEEMEERGIVGPANGSKPREVIHVP